MPGILSLLFCLILGLFLPLNLWEGSVGSEGRLWKYYWYCGISELPRKKQEERFCKEMVVSGLADRNTFEFLKRIMFSRVGEGGVFAAGIGAFHGVLISLKTQNFPTG